MNNYSFDTSLPAYHSHTDDKQRQADMIYQLIKSGVDNLLRLSEITGLEQGRCSARINDLIADNKVKYDGKVIYKNFTRKRICLNKPPVIGIEQTLF
jgi:hypothetical protein